MGFCPITKWYITVVAWSLMVCLIYTPSALEPAVLALWVYISGRVGQYFNIIIVDIGKIRSCNNDIADIFTNQ